MEMQIGERNLIAKEEKVGKKKEKEMNSGISRNFMEYLKHHAERRELFN